MNKKIFLSVIFSLLLCAIKLPATAQQPSLNITPSASPNKISLDVKGMDIVDVLKMLATRSGMNIVVGKNVAGKVTLFLKDVDTEDAFEIILLANGLAYDKEDNIINVMTARDYELLYGAPFRDKKQARIIKLNYAKAAELARSLAQFKTASGRIIVDESSNTVAIIDLPEVTKAMEDFILQADSPLETKIFDLNYGQAEKISAKLQEILTKNTGRIKIDERTNKMVVTDYPSKVKEMAEIIEAFDEKNLQVLIDAQIINLTPSDQFQMGVDWDYWIKKYFDLKVALPVTALTTTASAMFIGTTKTGDPNKPGHYKAIIDLLQTIGDTKVLSSPRIITLNNQEAKIHVGTREAYITSTTSQGTGPAITSQSVNFVDVGIQLHVTPTINKDGFVTMKIKPELSDAKPTEIKSEDQFTQIPIVSTSEAESTVMVKDGITIIIGGLRRDKRTKTVKKIPVLGDIPGLGVLFKSIDDKIEVNELIILLTPHIMSGEKAYSDFSELPPRDGVVAKMEKGEIVVTKTSDAPDAESEYHHSIINKLKTIALFNQPTGKKEKGEVKLNFTLAKDGRLIGEPYVLETSNSALSLAAIVAVKSSAPFAAFPAQVKKEQETFSISLAYE